MAPVITALTFGWASAADVSIDTMRAWAYGLARTAPCSMPGQLDVVEEVAPAAQEAGVLLAQHAPEADRVAGLGERDFGRAHDDGLLGVCARRPSGPTATMLW